MKIYIGIPARMGSSRFPGKPLAKINGMSMIEHVYRRCLFAENIDDVFIATCDKVIEDEVHSFGGKSIMTDPDIPRPALRVFAAAETLALDEDDIVITVQGDEPLFHPDMINLIVEPLLAESDVYVSNVMSSILSDVEWEDPNNVKVVTDRNMNAIYMSRNPIPSTRHEERRGKRYLQLGIIAFKWNFFKTFNLLAQGDLELAESIEMLRAIENGYKVRMTHSKHQTVGVDTPEDLKRVKEIMNDDQFYIQYRKNR